MLYSSLDRNTLLPNTYQKNDIIMNWMVWLTTDCCYQSYVKDFFQQNVWMNNNYRWHSKCYRSIFRILCYYISDISIDDTKIGFAFSQTYRRVYPIVTDDDFYHFYKNLPSNNDNNNYLNFRFTSRTNLILQLSVYADILVTH